MRRRSRQAPANQAVASDGERVKLAEHRPRSEAQRVVIVSQGVELLEKLGWPKKLEATDAARRVRPSGRRLSPPVDGFDYIEWDKSQVRLCKLGTDQIVALGWRKIVEDAASPQEGLF